LAQQVSNTQPFEVVFTLVQHPYFGMLIEMNAVLLNHTGTYSLTFQRIHKQTAAYFGLAGPEMEIIRLLDELDADNIVRTFQTGSKRIRPDDFFLKHFNPELFQTKIRPFIEKRLARVMEILSDRPVFLASATNNPTDLAVEVCRDHATVLFHFRRDEEGINYFATIKHRDEKLEFSCNGSQLFTINPPWMLVGNKLVRFRKGFDGKKIKPFLERKFIHIEKRQELDYMRKFVLPLLERYDVHSTGFNILTEQHEPSAVLRLENYLGGDLCVALYLRYGQWTFPYHSEKQVHVSMLEQNGEPEFHRIRRSRGWEEGVVQWLRDNGLQAVQGSIFCLPAPEGKEPDSLQLIEWLSEHFSELKRKGFVIDQNALSRKIFIGEVSLQLQVNKADDWFDLKARVQFGDFTFPFISLRKYILKNQREFPLPDGSIAIIPMEWMSRLAKVFHFGEEEGDSLRLRRMHYTLLDELQDFTGEELRLPEVLPDPAAAPDMPLPDAFRAELREYQKTGYNWLRYLGSQQLGACLADDMGLGKTVQTLAYVQWMADEMRPVKSEGPVFQTDPESASQLSLFEATAEEPASAPAETEPPARTPKRNGVPALIIAPTSLIYNWQQEASRFTPGLSTFVYAGPQRERQWHRAQHCDVLITSYGTLRNDIQRFTGLRFGVVVLDESQAIKNPMSQTARALVQLDAGHRIALTGTPVENTLLDLWSQMNFLNRGLLGSYRYFNDHYIKPVEKTGDKRRGAELARLIRPFVLRRTKQQVTPELPEKIEKTEFCEMTPAQRELYEETKSQYRNEIMDALTQMGAQRSRFKVIAGLTRLRQMAINPQLVHEDYEGGSGKDEHIIHSMQRALANGHKTLVFSQFVQHLQILENWLIDNDIPYCKLVGEMSGKERSQQIDRFQEDPEIGIFLLSLKAGNAGINLTSADYVLLCDPWWNPFVMKQAESRAHRIGQKKTVFSYKFITRDTIEEKIMRMQERKTELAGAVIEGDESWLGNLSEAEIEELFS
jgi:superfamily II DNA or RNA helicase